jgi:NADH-quinone oxidoreductase subunit D
MPRRVKAGEAISRIEAPRGELFYFIRSNGTDTPERVKVRTPTMSNLASVPALTVGRQLADVPMILVGVDPCFSCNDRTVTMRRARDGRLIAWEELQAVARRRYGRGDAG